MIEGAPELIRELERAGVDVVLASSAPEDEVGRYVEMLGVEGSVEWTTSGDVENTKPKPDLVEAALREGRHPRTRSWSATRNGTSKAAKRAGIPTIGVLTGGFSRAELSEAGAIEVYESVMGIAEDLDAALSR